MLHRVFPPVRPYTCGSFCRLNPTILGRNLSSQRRKIRMIILSDTHGNDLKGVSLPKADVVLHCGDLTNDSQSADLERTLAMLRVINAPLKLAIPGNHDFGLERGYWRRTRASSHPTQQQHDDSGVPAQTIEADDEDKDDVDAKASWELLRRTARRDRIFLLPQGTHIFVLPPDAGGGGTRLRLFASPLTPRQGNWGFQYDRSNPHKWAIPPTTSNGDGAVDVMMTHGPPRGIRDGTGMGKGGAAAGAGCAGLLAAVERARPRVHCFGHIHGAWGAELVTWKREIVALGAGAGAGGPVAFPGPSAPILGNLVDAQRSRVVASLPPASRTTGSGKCSLSPPPARVTQRYHSPPREEAGCFAVDISPDGEHAVERGAQTLFVNAAVELRSRPPRMPWLVDIDLPVASEEDAAAAAETMCRLLL
ncbi:putative rhamnogalacturonate lyase C [Madurella mycetomatis]|uniref:Putative rhamnogalacturonate lyase C n=1 Tax=Madurella mycetomatis TaxID=100816 RepID=A0A175VR28_9PEZI|nr:putative rhamnogalacturonate lyase C [Madurella mycetomatis]KXX83089.1 putative rhamnogalacturonate lyase C [Madurella mycetomatis]